MPVPEIFSLYGLTNLVVPNAPNNPINPAATQNRSVTRSVTLHYTHGWRYNSNQGVHFWIDLDGTLFQNNEADRCWRHVSGGPYFSTNNLVRNTSVSVEICRFGKFKEKPNGDWNVAGYTGLDFALDANDPEWCDYSSMGVTPGNRRFNLWKIPGGDTYENISRNYYKVKAAEFDDERNPEKPTYIKDILYSEEQYATLVIWLKSILEHYRIPKLFLRDPESGVENPWIDTDVLARRTKTAAIRNEAIERASSHQGVWGHMNLQRSRVDPGASMDYYRLKRGVSDEWWFPVNLDTNSRKLNYLDADSSAEYLALKEYGSLDDLEQYYRLNEDGEAGFFPIGINRVWHGGIHLNSDNQSKPVYAMANGWIVAARVSNGTVNGNNLSYSRCFVLIKHLVHTQDNGDEIDYGANSTKTVYSLYMHLEPTILTHRDDGAGGQRWDFDYDSMPVWLCHFLIDNPTLADVDTGALIYPNQKVDLSDHIGDTGTYITAMTNTVPKLGNTVHVEVFTTEDPNTFGANPWTNTDNRKVDPTLDDLIADLGILDNTIRDIAGDGIDVVDIKNATPSMRSFAVKSRSEWSLSDKSQLGHLQDVVTDTEWDTLIRPLCFQTDMAADASAPAADIGPFHGNTAVWHLHPFSFLEWMNSRVKRHERILAEQDKPRPNLTSNFKVEDGYITEFQNLTGANANQLTQNTGAVVYPEARYNENTYEVTIDKLVDQAALALAPQNTTRFNLRLLEAVDICNDRQHGLQIIEGYVSTATVQCSDASCHVSHNSGDAVDLRPANTTVVDWYNLYTSAINARTYLQEIHDLALEIQFVSDVSNTNPTQSELSQQAQELFNRIEAAANASDPLLTAAPALQYLDRMRLHLGVVSMAVAGTAALENMLWRSVDGAATSGPALAKQRLRIEVQSVGLAEGSMVDFFIMSELFNKTIEPDIHDIVSLQRIYQSRDFDLDKIERHHMELLSVDTYVQHVQKQISGVNEAGRATVICDWDVPENLPSASGTLYAVCIVGAGASRLAGGVTSEHTVAPVLDGGRIKVPHIHSTTWTSTSGSSAQVTSLSLRQIEEGFIRVDTVALPKGCKISISIRNMKNNNIIVEEERLVAQGSGTTIFSCAAPQRPAPYHATIKISGTRKHPIDLTSGASVEWKRR